MRWPPDRLLVALDSYFPQMRRRQCYLEVNWVCGALTPLYFSAYAGSVRDLALAERPIKGEVDLSKF